MFSDDYTERIAPDAGVGLEFEYNNKRYRTLPRGEWGLRVSVSVTTYAGIAFTSEGHFYASFSISALSCQNVEKPEESIYTNMQPEESRGLHIHIVAPAKETIYGESFGRKIVEVEKGQPTSRFMNVEECIRAIESEFQRLFGEPWYLSRAFTTEPWENYKKELLEEWGQDNEGHL